MLPIGGASLTWEPSGRRFPEDEVRHKSSKQRGVWNRIYHKESLIEIGTHSFEHDGGESLEKFLHGVLLEVAECA